MRCVGSLPPAHRPKKGIRLIETNPGRVAPVRRSNPPFRQRVRSDRDRPTTGRTRKELLFRDHSASGQSERPWMGHPYRWTNVLAAASPRSAGSPVGYPARTVRRLANPGWGARFRRRSARRCAARRRFRHRYGCHRRPEVARPVRVAASTAQRCRDRERAVLLGHRRVPQRGVPVRAPIRRKPSSAGSIRGRAHPGRRGRCRRRRADPLHAVRIPAPPNRPQDWWDLPSPTTAEQQAAASAGTAAAGWRLAASPEADPAEPHHHCP